MSEVVEDNPQSLEGTSESEGNQSVPCVKEEPTEYFEDEEETLQDDILFGGGVVETKLEAQSESDDEDDKPLLSRRQSRKKKEQRKPTKRVPKRRPPAKKTKVVYQPVLKSEAVADDENDNAEEQEVSQDDKDPDFIPKEELPVKPKRRGRGRPRTNFLSPEEDRLRKKFYKDRYNRREDVRLKMKEYLKVYNQREDVRQRRLEWCREQGIRPRESLRKEVSTKDDKLKNKIARRKTKLGPGEYYKRRRKKLQEWRAKISPEQKAEQNRKSREQLKKRLADMDPEALEKYWSRMRELKRKHNLKKKMKSLGLELVETNGAKETKAAATTASSYIPSLPGVRSIRPVRPRFSNFHEIEKQKHLVISIPQLTFHEINLGVRGKLKY